MTFTSHDIAIALIISAPILVVSILALLRRMRIRRNMERSEVLQRRTD